MTFQRFSAVLLLFSICAMGCNGTPNPASVNSPDSGFFFSSDPPITTATGDLPSGTGWITATMTIGSQERHALIYRPSAAANLPLLIVLHGTGGSPEALIDELGGRDSVAALIGATEPAVFIFPAAVEQAQGDWDHDGGGVFWRTQSDSVETNPDLFWMRYLVQNAQSQYGINARRVYAFGHSNGGFFSLKLAATFPSLFAGVGANAAGWARCLPENGGNQRAVQQYAPGAGFSCDRILATAPSSFTCRNTAHRPFSALPNPAVPTILLHASDDDVVTPYYSCDLAAALTATGATVRMEPLFTGGHFASSETLATAWRWLRAR